MHKLIIILIALLGTFTIHSQPATGRPPGRPAGKVSPARPAPVVPAPAPAPARTNASPAQLGPLYTINLHEPGVSVTVKASHKFTVAELRRWLHEASMKKP